MGKRGPEHDRVQKLGRERDMQTCQICGSTAEPEGHHVFDYQYGGDADVDNIVTLCRECHNKAHKGEIDIFVF